MSWGALAAPNFRGRAVPRLLGPALAVFGVASAVVYQVAGATSALPQWTAAGAAMLVFGAGLVDDLLSDAPRGIRSHARELASGRMTTGTLKVLVATAAAVVVVAQLERGSGWSRIGAVVLVAGCTNVWNGLDVRPGRALKAFAIVAAPLVVLRTSFWVARSLWVGALLALPIDLRERAMLGDSGSNLLGFVIGAQLAAILPTWGMWPAAGVAVALNVAGETVTFSRAINAALPLRWFDRLGRLPE